MIRLNKIGYVKVESYYKNSDDLLQEILSTVNEFIKDFQEKDPLQFLYEADIQARLACSLTERIPEPIEFRNIEDNQSQMFRMTPITREYPVKAPFDIACINPCMIARYVSWRIQQTNSGKYLPINRILWELPLLAAVEIKFSLFGYKVGVDSIKADVEKFRNYKKGYYTERRKMPDELQREFSKDFKYLALIFFQDENWFKKRVDLLKKVSPSHAIKTMDRIDEFDRIYMISHDKQILKYNDKGYKLK